MIASSGTSLSNYTYESASNRTALPATRTILSALKMTDSYRDGPNCYRNSFIGFTDKYANCKIDSQLRDFTTSFKNTSSSYRDDTASYRSDTVQEWLCQLKDSSASYRKALPSYKTALLAVWRR
jgi:hypothetical protein